MVVDDSVIDEIRSLTENWSESMRMDFMERILRPCGVAKGWVTAAVVNYLIDMGCTSIAFREKVLLPNNLAAYIDVYSSDLNIYAICATIPGFSWIKSRVDEIKSAVFGAEVLVAFQDVAGWLIEPDRIGADHVLIIGRDGRAMSVEEWRRGRRATLERELMKFSEAFISLERDLRELRRLGAEAERARNAECRLITWCLLDIAGALGVEANVSGLLEGRLYRAPQDATIRECREKVKSLSARMFRAFVEFANTLLSYYTPFKLSVTDEGDLSIEEDLRSAVWLKDFIFRDGGFSAALSALTREVKVLSEIVRASGNSVKPPEGLPAHSTSGQRGMIMVPREIVEEILRKVERIRERLGEI